MISANKQFFLFILSGGFAAIINIFSRAILSNFLTFERAIIFAYCIGMIVAFLLTKRFVFISKNNIYKSFAAFALVNIAAVAQTYFISMWCKDIILPFGPTNLDITKVSLPIPAPSSRTISFVFGIYFEKKTKFDSLNFSSGRNTICQYGITPNEQVCSQ